MHGGHKDVCLRGNSILLLATKDSGAIVICKTTSSKIWKLENAIERHSAISGLRNSIALIKEIMSGFAMKVDPSGSSL